MVINTIFKNGNPNAVQSSMQAFVPFFIVFFRDCSLIDFPYQIDRDGSPFLTQAILNAMKSHILMLNKQNVEKISLKKFNFSISEKSEESER